MQLHRLTTQIVGCAAMALAFTVNAHALSNQTFISVSGHDSGTCPSADPCASITYALTQTNPGGEIVIATSGVYTPATIDQAVTVTAGGSVDASVSATTGNALVINTTGNVTLNGFYVRGHGTATNGIVVEAVHNLRLFNLQVQYFMNNGIDFKSASSDLSVYGTTVVGNGHDGLILDAADTRAYVEGSSFDDNVFAGADSGTGKLTIYNSSAHYNQIGFYAHGGTVTLSNDRAILNSIGLDVSAAGHLHFANCLLSDNTTAWKVVPGGTLSGSNPGTTLVAPGQATSGTPSTATVLE